MLKRMSIDRQRLRRFDRTMGARVRSAANYPIAATLSVVPAPLKTKKGRENCDSLRFRIGLKNGTAVEGALIRDVNIITYSRVPFSMDVSVNDVQCFRRALFGDVYKEYVGLLIHQAGVRTVNDKLVAAVQDECLTDDEARGLFRMVCAEAIAKVYDWDRVFNICFLGTWDHNHPWLSVLSLVVLGLLFLVLNVLIRPLIVKVDNGLLGLR